MFSIHTRPLTYSGRASAQLSIISNPTLVQLVIIDLLGLLDSLNQGIDLSFIDIQLSLLLILYYLSTTLSCIFASYPSLLLGQGHTYSPLIAISKWATDSRMWKHVSWARIRTATRYRNGSRLTVDNILPRSISR